jgi:hypothetical protein
MKRWAVGYFNLCDNTLTIEIVTGENWLSALRAHSLIKDSGHLEGLPTDIEEAKQEFFNQDAMFDVVEIH